MLRIVALVSVVFFLIPSFAQAEDCDEWLPDFTCEDREARPDGVIPPVSMPYYFEDPYVTTEVSVHGLWHQFPWESVFRSGDAYVLAIQARLALTDRLAFIATKDGYTWMRPGHNSQVKPDEGFFDLLAGFKYALIRDEDSGLVVTPAARFSIPVGNSNQYSGKGKGAFVPSVSAALPFFDFNGIGSVGFYQPFNMNRESSFLFYNVHVSTPALAEGRIIPFVEVNGMTYTQSGSGRRRVDTKAFGKVNLNTAQGVLHGLGVTPHVGFEGNDVVNLGSRNVSGNTIVTHAYGIRIPVTKKVSVAGYWEGPLTHREDIFAQRIGINALYTF